MLLGLIIGDWRAGLAGAIKSKMNAGVKFRDHICSARIMFGKMRSGDENRPLFALRIPCSISSRLYRMAIYPIGGPAEETHHAKPSFCDRIRHTKLDDCINREQVVKVDPECQPFLPVLLKYFKLKVCNDGEIFSTNSR